MLGGALWDLKAILDADDAVAGPNGATDALFFVVPLLLSVGLAGLYARYAGLVPGLGQTGFYPGLYGARTPRCGFRSQLSFKVEGSEQILSFGFLILAFGLVLLGFATLKTEALARRNFLPLAVGVLIPLEVIPGGVAPLGVVLSAPFGLGWVPLGYLLWTDKAETVERVPPP